MPAVYPGALVHAPRPLPDRIVLTWRGDPASTQAVTWRTDTSVEGAVAEIAVANESGRDLEPRTVSATTTLFESDIGAAHYHSVEFVDLKPDTLFAYRVGDGANWSEWFHFRTASRELCPFSFRRCGNCGSRCSTSSRSISC